MKIVRIISVLLSLISCTCEARSWKWIGPESATIQSIIADRNHPSTFYILTGPSSDLSRIYRSTDAAQTWHPCPLKNVSQLRVHPQTSELYALTVDAIRYESHLWYSPNKGRNFFARNSGRAAPDLIFLDPFNSRHLYGSSIGTSTLSFSNNGGDNWSDLKNLPFHVGQHLKQLGGRMVAGVFYSDVLVPFTAHNTIFAAGEMTAAPDFVIPFLIRSKDRGRTWKVLETKVTTYDDAYRFRTDPLFPDRAFALNGEGIKKLQGDQWEKLSDVVFQDVISLPDSPNLLLGWSFNNINGALEFLLSSDEGRTWKKTDLDLNNTIRLVQSMKNGLLAGTNGGGIYRRITGKDWQEVNHGLKQAYVTDVEQNRSGTIVYALLNNHFLYRTTDAGKNWQNLTFTFPFALDDTYITPIYLNPSDGRNILADHGPIAVSKDAGQTWTNLSGGFNNPAFDPNQSNVVYFSLHKRILKSTEAGTNPSALPLKFPYFEVKTIVDPYNSKTLYFLSSTLFKSTDGGLTMHAIEAIQQPLSMSPLPEPNAFVVLTADGSVYRTNDAGASWNLLSNVFLVSYGERKIAAASANHLFLIQAQSFLESVDGGVSWKDITGEFGRDFAKGKSLIFDIGDPRSPRFCVATSRGVFVEEP